MQTQIIAPGILLNDQGLLNQVGYAKKLLLEYQRDDIKANALRIKEWDYYLIANNDFAVALTIADNSYMGLISASLLDFRKPWQQTASVMTLFPMGKTKLPSTSETGDVNFVNSRVSMEFINDGLSRKLYCHFYNFKDKKPLAVEIELASPAQDSMVIVTPFKDKPKHFYYNQKINCLPASGFAEFDGETFAFEPNTAFGVLDWGRGVWTYDNVWYWGSASGKINDNYFGFNIGYGFGDTSKATENMLFYNGVSHKLTEVSFNIPQNDAGYEYSKPWTFTSSDGRFEMDFVPIIDRNALTSAGIILSDQHQVFGKYTGKAVLDNGFVVEVKDFLGFAERVHNKW